MESKKSAFNIDSLLLGVLILLALAVTTVAVIPSLRQEFKGYFFPNERKILAKIRGDLTGQGALFTILKIQSGEDLFLEVYIEEGPDDSALLAKINLTEKRDGYFSLKGNATNLGLTDVDGDGTLEIIAPTFDDQMVARLNIYKFNIQTRNFDRVNAPASSF
ncbi:MAG: hypothetical protein IPM97_04150 [Bdellovibrionaceae bacterium]|nr:hypothetical protein [Pseudobdellovibrionaceae bacterium]